MQDTEACPWRQRASVEPSPVLATWALEVPGGSSGVVSWALESGYSLRGGRAQSAPPLEPRWEPFLNGMAS